MWSLNNCTYLWVKTKLTTIFDNAILTIYTHVNEVISLDYNHSNDTHNTANKYLFIIQPVTPCEFFVRFNIYIIYVIIFKLDFWKDFSLTKSVSLEKYSGQPPWTEWRPRNYTIWWKWNCQAWKNTYEGDT